MDCSKESTPDSKESSRSFCETPDYDPWALPELQDQGEPWSGKSFSLFNHLIVWRQCLSPLMSFTCEVRASRIDRCSSNLFFHFIQKAYKEYNF
jgi:hypothetical protein